MSKHTPGPWIAQTDPDAISSDDWVIGIEGAPIDYVATCSRRDASLIAAAPELLEALLAMRIVMDAGSKPSKLDAALTWRECDEKARSMCDAAIAKAAGVQA